LRIDLALLDRDEARSRAALGLHQLFRAFRARTSLL